MGDQELTAEQRHDLGRRLGRIVTERFSGSAKDAYTHAGVNSGTWTRAVAGESVRNHTLVRIVNRMWPDTKGDWHLIDPPLGEGDPELDALIFEVRKSNLPAWAKERLLSQLFNAARSG